MFNSAGYAEGSSRRISTTSRWVTAEPVAYGLGYASQRAEAPEAADAPAEAAPIFGGDSPAPSNPMQELFAPLEGTLTPDASRRRAAGGHHRPAGTVRVTITQRGEESGMVNTPVASTIRRQAPAHRQQIVSPTSEGDDRAIADKLANLWTEYVKQPTTNTSSYVHTAEVTTTKTTVALQEGGATWANTTEGPYLHPTKRWLYRHVLTPENVLPPQQPLLHPAGFSNSQPTNQYAQQDRDRGAQARGYPQPEERTTPPLPSSTLVPSTALQRAALDESRSGSWLLPQSSHPTGDQRGAAQRSFPIDERIAPTLRTPSATPFLGASTTSFTSDQGYAPTYERLQTAPSYAAPSHTQQTSLAHHHAPPYHHVEALDYRTPRVYHSTLPRSSAPDSQRNVLRSTSPPMSHASASQWQPYVAHTPWSSATEYPGPHIGTTARPHPVHVPMSSGVLEAARTLEERERGQREHIRFIEAQGRKNVLTRAALERPIERHVRGDLISSMQPVDSSTFLLPPSNVFARAVVSEHAPRGVPLEPTSLRMSPPRSVSPHRRGPFLFERMAQIKDTEMRGRLDLELAERQVRDAVCSVIGSLQRHADAAAAQQAIHRSLLMTISDEQESRKKVEVLEAHIVGTIQELYRDATQSLITVAYERISFLTRLYSKMHADESRQRLEAVDEEVLSRRSLMVALHEAELALYQAAAARLTDAHRAGQRAIAHESELRFGIVQDEDRIRSDRYTRWAHERSVLEHLERQRLSSSRAIFSKMRTVQDQEKTLRVDIEETEARMHATLAAYAVSAYERHRQLQQETMERTWLEAQRRESVAKLREVEEREETLRREGVMAWECVVEALLDWKAEMALQQELEAQFERRKKLVLRLQQVEDIEHSARIAITFAEEAVHSQHLSWAREMASSLREARASALARVLHALSTNESFTRSQIAEEAQRAIASVRHGEHAAHTALLLFRCHEDEDEGRATVQWQERSALSIIAQVETTERQVHTDREFRAACRRHEHLAMLEAYSTAEDDSRLGVVHTETGQRDSLLGQFRQEAKWITEHIEARRKAADESRRDLILKESSAREERLVAEAQEWFELSRSEEAGHRRAMEAESAAQRQREYQLRASTMTLNRLEEVNRDVIIGAAAKSFQSLEERQSVIWNTYKEEHHRMLRVMEERNLRTLDERRRLLFDNEAIARGEVVDVEVDMWKKLKEQFHLRRPLAESDNPQVVQLLATERKGRLDLDDLFTYERWNLVDLETMSRDDVADGVAPLSLPRNDERSLSRPTQHLEQQLSPGNEFAQFVEESFPHRAHPPPPQPPHPTSWEYEDLSPPREYDTIAPVRRLAFPGSAVAEPVEPEQQQPSVARLKSAPPLKAPASRPIHSTADVQAALAHMRPSTSIVSSTTQSAAATPTSDRAERDLLGHGPGSTHIPDALRAALRPVVPVQQLPRSMPPPPRTAPSMRGSPPRAAPSMSTEVRLQMTSEVLSQESEGRRRLGQTQYQHLAAIIQENIETLPDA